MLIRSRLPASAWGLPAIWVLLATGCGREDVHVYRVPKEEPPASAAAHGHGMAMAMPRITWKAPPGWKEQDSGGVRIVRFAVPNSNGPSADVGVVPLSGAGIGHAQIVNMVRNQVDLGPLTEEDLAKQAEKVSVGPVQGELFEMASTNALLDGKFKACILMATATHDQTLWLFKIAGPDDLVAAQRPAFLDFLKSVQFVAASDAGGVVSDATGPTAEGPGTAPNSRPQWEVPAGWQEQAPGPMVLARFAVGDSNGKAEVTVSAFPGDTGGLLANVNRWRGQLGLPPVEEPELEKLVKPLDAPAGKATLVDMTGTDRKTGQPARLIGAILPRGGQTWFFKMLGDAQVAEREKAAFLKFIQSTKLPNV